MHHSRRLLLLATAATAGLLVTAPGLGQSAAPAATIANVPPSQPWPQAASDLPVDSNARYGALPNGMRYVLLHNATPPGQTSLRLRIDAGSLYEKDNQLGLAHFMEHMAFNGTTHIPKNELISILERLGLAFGADLNAATGFDETFYQLELPRSNDETIDTALRVFREQVSEATMDPDDIVDERGVIAGEERLRNTPKYRVSQAQFHVFGKGLKLPDRMPIGDLKIVNTAPRERFVDFYNSYYRPSRATLIAVGDFDVAVMEAKIRKAFGDWQPKAPDGPEPDLGKVAAHGRETYMTVEPGISSNVSLNWIKAPDLTPDSNAKRRRDLIQRLGLAVLRRRLGELSRTDDGPFLTADVSDSSVVRSVRITAVSANFISGKWQPALAAIDQEQRRLVQYGVSDAELQREVTTIRTSAQEAVKGASNRQSRRIAGELLTTVNNRLVFTSAQTDLDLFEEAVKGLTTTEVNAELKGLFPAGAPVTMVATPQPITGGETAVAAALDRSRQVAVAAPVAPKIMPWPYNDFGKPGTVTARSELADLGATVITFANGVTLTVKPTTFSKDSVRIRVLTGSGELNFSPDRFEPDLAMIGGMHMGGLGKLNVDDVSRSLAGHDYGAGLSVLGDRFMLGGGTRRRDDLQLEMQMLAAYLTDPAFRTNYWEKTKEAQPALYEALRGAPGTAFALYTSGLLAGGDKRRAIAPPEVTTNWSMDAERPRLKALLSKGPIHITMVGDVSIDEAIRVTASTFGALPPRPAVDAPVPGADQRRFPAPTPEVLRFTHEGLAEQGLGYVAWPATDSIRDLSEGRRIAMLGAVLKLRVLDEIRERLGLAYAPGVGTESSEFYEGYGEISVRAETAPEKLPAFFAAVDAIAQNLRDKPITEDELKRARAPMIENMKRSRSDNNFWIAALTYVVDRPSWTPQLLADIDDIQTLTPVDIQALARKYLKPELAWKAEVVPEAAAPTKPK